MKEKLFPVYALLCVGAMILFIFTPAAILNTKHKTEEKLEDDFQRCKRGCELSAFEDEHYETRKDIAPYTVCECIVTNDNNVTRACCCFPD